MCLRVGGTGDAESRTIDEAADVACRPPAIEPSADPNIFSPEQENDLGDAVAERVGSNFRVIEDPALTAPLRAIGERLMTHVPPSPLRLRFSLIELPEANAFVLPGGRIYVSRKLVAFATSEDELAGVIAHELGHVIARQHTIAVSNQFKKVLGIASVTDRADIFEKYHRLLDNIARKPDVFRQQSGHDSKEQVAADRIGIFILAAAGYDPSTYAQFWDRYAETGGRTGGFLSDLFGQTSPESRRLREAIRAMTSLPPGCVDQRSKSTDAYRRWQMEVLSFTAAPPAERLSGVRSKVNLAPNLRGEVTHLRFSPDGRHILAQDDSGITILSRTPFAPVFRIDAPDATPATFTPDSSHVVFHRDFRVETWRIDDRRLDTVHEVIVRQRCLQTLLAPDGRTLACLDTDFGLSIVDVPSGTMAYQKPQFAQPDLRLMLDVLLGAEDDSPISMGFSTDARYFAAGFRTGASLLFDVPSRAVVALNTTARRFIADGFVFTGPDRLVARNPDDPAKSAILTVPGGERTASIALVRREMSAATRGNFLFARPFQQFAVGVMDLTKGQITRGLTTRAVDIFDDVLVAERGSGEMGLYAVANNQLQQQTAMPATRLGRLRSWAASPDLKWIAASERTRGAVWEVARGRRVFHVRGFRGAAIDDAGRAVLDMPKSLSLDRQMVQLNGANGEETSAVAVKDVYAAQYGDLLVVRTPVRQGGRLADGFTLDVRDARSATPLWTKKFGTESPVVNADPVSGRIVLGWSAATSSLRGDLRRDPGLRARLDELEDTQGDQILQVFDGRTGQQAGTVMVETGRRSFSIRDIATAGDWVAIGDSTNRTRVYSLGNGELRGRIFGNDPVVNAARGLVAVRNGANHVTVHDASTLATQGDYTFAAGVSFVAFSADGQRLLVVTNNQVATVLDLK
jgi:hypothetical protein